MTDQPAPADTGRTCRFPFQSRVLLRDGRTCLVTDVTDVAGSPRPVLRLAVLGGPGGQVLHAYDDEVEAAPIGLPFRLTPPPEA